MNQTRAHICVEYQWKKLTSWPKLKIKILLKLYILNLKKHKLSKEHEYTECAYLKCRKRFTTESEIKKHWLIDHFGVDFDCWCGRKFDELNLQTSASGYTSDFSHSETSSVFEIRSKKLTSQISTARENFKLKPGRKKTDYLSCSRLSRISLVNEIVSETKKGSPQNFDNCISRISRRIKSKALVIVFSRNKNKLDFLQNEMQNHEELKKVTVINQLRSCELEFDDTSKKIILTSQLSILGSLNRGVEDLISFIHLKDRKTSAIMRRRIEKIEFSKFIIPKSIFLYFDKLKLDEVESRELMIKSLSILKRRLTVSSKLEIDDVNAALNAL